MHVLNVLAMYMCADHYSHRPHAFGCATASCAAHSWCRDLSDRWASSIINTQLTHLYFRDGTGGIVLSPNVKLFCAYPGDGDSQDKLCDDEEHMTFFQEEWEVCRCLLYVSSPTRPIAVPARVSCAFFSGCMLLPSCHALAILQRACTCVLHTYAPPSTPLIHPSPSFDSPSGYTPLHTFYHTCHTCLAALRSPTDLVASPDASPTASGASKRARASSASAPFLHRSCATPFCGRRAALVATATTRS